MTKNIQLTGIQTSGGTGSRARPLNLYSSTSMIPKGLMRIMGIPIAELQLEQLKKAGIKDIHILTQHLENREHLSNRFSNGSKLGLNINYSTPHDDSVNNGSGDAMCTNLEKRMLTGTSAVLANDNLYEIPYKKVLEEHKKLGSVISILSVLTKPRNTTKNYGIVSSDISHRVKALYEKPDNEKELMEILGVDDSSELDSMRVPINTAGYIIDNDALSKILKEDWIVKGRKKSSGNFDMAGSLIKGLIEKNYPVYHIFIDAWGDLGSTSFFLDTFPDALIGKFPSIFDILRERGYENLPNNIWVHPETLHKKDVKGKTLEEKIETGDVNIGPDVFIGRETDIEEGAEIRYSNIEKYGKIGRNAKLDHTYLSSYCNIGPYSNLRRCALGLQVKVNSSRDIPVYINGNSIIGPEIEVPRGTRMERTKIYPGYKFKEEGGIYDNVILEPTAEEIAETLKKYQEPKEKK